MPEKTARVSEGGKRIDGVLQARAEMAKTYAFPVQRHPLVESFCHRALDHRG
jgi:hypothetical protein